MNNLHGDFGGDLRIYEVHVDYMKGLKKSFRFLHRNNFVCSTFNCNQVLLHCKYQNISSTAVHGQNLDLQKLLTTGILVTYKCTECHSLYIAITLSFK